MADTLEDQAKIAGRAARAFLDALNLPKQDIIQGKNGPSIYVIAALREIEFEVNIGFTTVDGRSRLLAKNQQEQTSNLKIKPIITVGITEVKDGDRST